MILCGRTSAGYGPGRVSSPYHLKHVATHEARGGRTTGTPGMTCRPVDHRFVPLSVVPAIHGRPLGLTEGATGRGRTAPSLSCSTTPPTSYGWSREGHDKLLQAGTRPRLWKSWRAHPVPARLQPDPAIDFQARSSARRAWGLRADSTGSISLAEVIENALLESSAGAAAVRRLTLPLALTRFQDARYLNRLLELPFGNPRWPTGMTAICMCRVAFPATLCGSCGWKGHLRDQRPPKIRPGAKHACCANSRTNRVAGRGRIRPGARRTADTPTRGPRGLLITRHLHVLARPYRRCSPVAAVPDLRSRLLEQRSRSFRACT